MSCALRLLLVALWAVVAAACSSGDAGARPTASLLTAPDPTPATASTTVPVLTGSAPSTVAPSTTSEPDAPGAVRTPTGVLVPVVGPFEGRWLVRTPCGGTAVVEGSPVAPVQVVIDPGHGGPVDTGAVGANGLVERDLNLDVAIAAVAALAERGITAELTRTTDHAITLAVRSELADALDAALLISVHHNAPAATPSDEPGTEVFVQSGSAESQWAGALVHDEVVAALRGFDGVQWTTAADAGVLLVQLEDGRDAYGMIRRPSTPSVLAELGYLANPSEAELFATDAYVTVAGDALAEAAVRFLEEAAGEVTPGLRVFRPSGSAAGIDCADPPLG